MQPDSRIRPNGWHVFIGSFFWRRLKELIESRSVCPVTMLWRLAFVSFCGGVVGSVEGWGWLLGGWVLCVDGLKNLHEMLGFPWKCYGKSSFLIFDQS